MPVPNVEMEPQYCMAKINSLANFRAESILPAPKDSEKSEGTAKATRDRSNNNNNNNNKEKNNYNSNNNSKGNLINATPAATLPLRNNRKPGVRSDQATRIIIIITAYYFLSSLPSLFSQTSPGQGGVGVTLFLHRLAILLYTTNYFFNAFVYVLSSKEFRVQTVKLFKCN